MTTADRLKQVIDIKKMNLKEFAELADIPYSTLQCYLLKTRRIGFDTLLKLHKAFNVNLHWLMTGEGEMFINNPTPENEVIENKINNLPDDEETLMLATMFRELPNSEKMKILALTRSSWLSFKNSR